MKSSTSAAPLPTSSASAAASADAIWTRVAMQAPDGLAVVDAAGRWVRLNATAEELCGRPSADLVGTPSPFHSAGAVRAEDIGLLDDGDGEQVCHWSAGPGELRDFAYRTRPLHEDGSEPAGALVVSFRDCSAERHRRRRVAAIARASATIALESSVPATLDALAREVLRADAMAGVQILTLDSIGELRVMGAAGFRRLPDFLERLMECRRRGAALRMFDAFDSHEPVVVGDRWQALRDDPAWEPLREYLGEVDWSWFASVPLLIRGRSAGVLNAYFAPGQVVGHQTLEFLTAMAEQAAVAVDYAALLQAEREVVRREERQRLARDLHDSIVQQVFSIGMQAKVLGVVADRGGGGVGASVRRVSEEVGILSQTVLADLRAMVHELRPLSSTQLGLEEALRSLVESTKNRTGMRVGIQVSRGLDGLPAELAEDAYRIVAEALHNTVKHAEASRVTVRIDLRNGRLGLTISDNGTGLPADLGAGQGSGGYGLTSMRDRAERWGGACTIGPRPGGVLGTAVRAQLPVPPEPAAERRTSAPLPGTDHRPEDAP